jgi:hypothetical protein
MPYKIALMIPCTSRKRDEWETIQDSYLFKYTLKTFLATADTEHRYILYVGIDEDDRIFSKKKEQKILVMFGKVYPFLKIEFISMQGIPPGHLTMMWNRLFLKAYEDQCDYFFQCGDDMSFTTQGWVNDCIHVLNENDNLGVTGPWNNNNFILTQTFVSREHMKIFGQYFPESIVNWCCDDWINFVYYPDYIYPLKEHYCSNEGGLPRYDVTFSQKRKEKDGDEVEEEEKMDFSSMLTQLRKDTAEMAKVDSEKIMQYVLRQ